MEIYLIQDLIADVEKAWDTSGSENDLIAAVKKCTARAVASKAAWFEDRMRKVDEEQGYSLHPLYERPDHTLAIFALSWLSGRGAPPHDHGTWAVIGGLAGLESHTIWARTDDQSSHGYAELKPSYKVDVRQGERGRRLSRIQTHIVRRFLDRRWRAMSRRTCALSCFELCRSGMPVASTVYFSWQIDTPTASRRNFLRDAPEDACRALPLSASLRHCG